MSKLSLFYPVKPFIVTQGWGISNPTYLQYGFSKHNGVDFKPFNGAVTFPLYAPCEFKVVDVGNNAGAGNYIRFVTQNRYDVLDTNCLVGGMFMHMKEQQVKIGDIVSAGDTLGIANNTGNSTGPHTHLSLYRLSNEENIPANRLDLDPATNNTFDPQPYWNGNYAIDIQIGLLKQLITLLNKFLPFIK